ncbi:MAG TPA: HlyD family efflux transporter periplasmic adaptor subunit [Pyrinomonadaceae bacterium]|nr:HlyD family efflux transporter periplasmic adaptor subunit [Pyrinomonadaceae bacterium]
MSTATYTEAGNGAATKDRAKAKKAIRAALLLTVLAAATFVGWRYVFSGPAVAPGVIQVSGRIEGDDSVVASKTSGRIREITVREGDEVKAGQVVALLDDEQIRAREEQAAGAVRQAEARVRWAEQQIAVLEAELEQTRLGTDQAKLDAEGHVRQAEATVAATEAQLAQAESEYRKARADEERYTSLAASGDIPEQTGSHARSNAEAHAAAVRASRKQVEVARAALTSARATLANPAIRSTEGSRIRQQMVQAQSDIAAAQAERERAQAQLSEAQANRQDLQIVAPMDGTVATRSAEPGEVVAPGTPVLTLVNLSTVYLRGFVPEGEIGRVRTGQRAEVFLDSAPDKPIEAVVSRIDPEASFTPENTYFRDDRVKQVVGVKLVLKGATGYAKPGMPADGKVFVGPEELAAR